MKVLSLLQPWASLCVTIDPATGKALKQIETRSWNTKYRGTMLIHASAGRQYKKLADDDDLFKYYYPLFAFNKIEPIEKLPFGAIIGSVELVEVFKFVDLLPDEYRINWEDKGRWPLTEQELAFGDYTEGRYGWLLSNPVKFKHPIPAKGKLSIWDYQFYGKDENHILQCNECGYSACNDAFGLDKMSIDTEGEEWDVWCPKCECREQTLIIDNLPY